ncbi:sulfatase [Nocardioides sp. zg-536]|uniref:Sulfatase n=1 Tax=Nocardioides faecalis TaxID=2803858 RepID=A0A939BYG0_9ACTN|nr:sulfatase [Nocardioides faecalis]MBM9459895.1 sulfatase [Nocardioides faecalis]QVI58873.1 sulfatase [Nocardioides faecalis]
MTRRRARRRARQQRRTGELRAALSISERALLGIEEALAPVPGTGVPVVAPSPTPELAPGVARPNVLVITVDDLAAIDMPYLPRVRRLMEAGGVAFADALAPTPLCAPSRASLLSGQYAHNHGARTVNGVDGGYQAFSDADTLATALAGAGYDTLFTGKYINGYGKDGTERDVPRGWSDWRATVDPSTYNFFDPKMNVNGVVARARGYTTDVMTAHAREMIGADRGGRPWFAWVNYVAPHVGGPAGKGDPKQLFGGTPAGDLETTVPAPRDRGRYRRVPLPLFPSSFPDGDPTVPAHAPANQRRFDALQRRAFDVVYQRRIEAARGLDRAVARLFATLRRTGQLDRTLVVFHSDNGYAIGPHNMNGKRFHYDESLRVPLYMRGPGLPRGVVVSTAVTVPDLTATILAATGVTPPRPLDGVDVRPWVTAAPHVRVVPIAAWGAVGARKVAKQIYAGVRVGSWTYVEYRRGGAELYDRARDPFEIHNLADDPSYGEVRAVLSRLSARYAECAGPTSPRELFAVDRLEPGPATPQRPEEVATG